MNGARELEHVQTIVVGGGQAGLAVGYYLSQHGFSYMILDANERIGDSWRKRWDSLRLFTPARYDGLPGMPFPAAGHQFPTKDEMADYLESYATHFALPIRTGIKVDGLSRQDDRFMLTAGDRRFVADNVVVAMASWQCPWVPSFARELDPDIVQLHAGEYRNPSQLRDGGVLVVGAGNSGAEIGFEAARSHPTWISGRDNGQLPFDIDGLAARYLLLPLVLRFFFHHALTRDTPIGRKVRLKVLSHGMPRLRIKHQDLSAAGIERVGRTVGVRDGQPLLEDGRVLDVTNVVWCTGFRPDCSWIDLPIIGQDGEPIHERGVVAGTPGLYFVGLLYLYAPSSAMVHGVGRDAAYIVEAIASREIRPPTGCSAPPRSVTDALHVVADIDRSAAG